MVAVMGLEVASMQRSVRGAAAADAGDIWRRVAHDIGGE